MSPTSWDYQTIIERGYDPKTMEGIGSLYASDPGWAQKVKTHMINIFGNLLSGAIAGTNVSANMSFLEVRKLKQIQNHRLTYG
jgi:hypothetical protein